MRAIDDIRHCDLTDAAGGRSACEGRLYRPGGVPDDGAPRRPPRYRRAARLRCECGALLWLRPDGSTVGLDTSRKETYLRTPRTTEGLS